MENELDTGSDFSPSGIDADLADRVARVFWAVAYRADNPDASPEALRGAWKDVGGRHRKIARKALARLSAQGVVIDGSAMKLNSESED